MKATIRPSAVFLGTIVLLWASAMPCAQALHVVSDEIPDGDLRVAPGAKASLFLDVDPGDLLQWTWSDQSGHANALSTQLFWTDVSAREHGVAPLPAGQTFGNFQAPKELMGARLEWRNDGAEPSVIKWSYYTTASFWKRPEYFLPAMLPLFLLAGAFYFGRLIDKRRASKHTTNLTS